jgi:hypothetical protein
MTGEMRGRVEGFDAACGDFYGRLLRVQGQMLKI